MNAKSLLAALGMTTALATAGVVWIQAGSQAATGSGGLAPPPTVVVAQPTVEAVTEWDEYTGRFTATDNVEIRSRVGGHLVGIHFRDGQIVREGDRLFSIDPRPFEVALAVARAQVAEAEARVELAEAELERSQTLYQQRHVSEAQVDQDRAELRSAEAARAAARASVLQAAVDLDYTEIRAPIGGRVDNHYVDIGNLVEGSDGDATVLTTIVALDPIHVVFDVHQNAYLRYARQDLTGSRASSRDVAHPVQVAPPDGDTFRHEGRMDFIANQVDAGTGTIRARAVLENDDLLFTPGMFARVRLVSREEHPAVLIPDSAVATEQSDRVVYVVGADDRVEARIVTLGPLVDGLRVIRDGLTADDRVVVEGLHRARTGDLVTVQPLADAAIQVAEGR